MLAALGTAIVATPANVASAADGADVRIQLNARGRWQRHQRHQHLHRP